MNIPWWYYAVAILIGVVIGIWKKPSFGLLVGYTFLLLVETVFIRHSFVGKHFRPQLFWSWKAWDKQRNQILTNVVMFVPAGFLSGCLWKWKGLLVDVGISIVIEVLQLVTARGLMEFDDIIHNTLGAAIGIIIVIITKVVKEKLMKDQKQHGF